MQTGFGLLESGCVSRKNEVNILMKNVADVVVGGLGYWCFGYGLQFSSGGGSVLFNGFGFFLVDAELQDMGRTFACFLFQLSFATTATTIVSGAMAERTNFTAYCIFSFFDTLVFSIPAGWLWASRGFLRQLGALDFAGAGCVHLLGGTSALVAAAYLGPRVGRYGSGPPPELGNPTSVLQGVFTLWKFLILNIVSGLLTGLVSVTGGSAYLGALDSVLVGSLGALLSSGVSPLLNKFHVDDPVDAVSVHGCGGAWGLLAIGLFVHDFSDQDGQDDQDEQCSRCGLFRGGSAYLLAIQALTCVSLALWSAVTTYILLVIVNRLVPIRLSLEHEVLGADLVEHGIVHPDIDYAQLLRRNGVEPSKLLPPHMAERLDREAWDLRLCRSYLAERLGGRGVQRQEPNSFWSFFRRRQTKQIHP
ncbi:putative ammonium transporter 2 [Rhipicephalus sanguineus]|uniref:putative ammonium transporter 2 n=1 Tax=Rhipicephalus sanguineus TaxID=34632 RepID=UPI0020C38F92|nr:putative ammonium transporter 2 [Rhipicephalus sanguineus]